MAARASIALRHAGIEPDCSSNLRKHRPNNRGKQSQRPRAEITCRQRDCEESRERQDLPVPGILIDGLKQPQAVRPHSHSEIKTHQMRANWGTWITAPRHTRP